MPRRRHWRLDETRQREKQACVRLTAEEQAEIDQLAAERGLSRADYMRAAALSAPPIRSLPRRPPTAHQEELRDARRTLGEVVRLLGNATGNLNQVAHLQNRTQLPAGDGQIEVACSEIRQTQQAAHVAIKALLQALRFPG